MRYVYPPTPHFFFHLNSTMKRSKIVIMNYNIKNSFYCGFFIISLIYRDVCLTSYIFKFFGRIFVVYSSLLILKISPLLCTKLVGLCNNPYVYCRLLHAYFYFHENNCFTLIQLYIFYTFIKESGMKKLKCKCFVKFINVFGGLQWLTDLEKLN